MATAEPVALQAASMDRKALSSHAAIGVAGLTIAIVIGSLLVWVARGMTPMPVSFGSSPVGVLGLVISPIAYAAVGGVLASRLGANPVGWLFLAMGIALGIMLPVNLMVTAAHEALRPADAVVVWLAWARTAFGTPVVLTSAVVAVQLFPDGRTLGGRWRAGPWIGLAGGTLLLLTTALDPVGLITYPSIANPLAVDYGLRDVVALARTGAVALLVGVALVAVAAVWRRYHLGDQVVQAQLRWIVVAVVVTVAAALPFVAARYVLRVTDATGEVLAAVAQIAAVTFPVAAAMAISRYRLFDIDVVIGRSLVYLPLMAVLGGMYTAGIALFQRVFVAVTGSESEAAVVMSILVVASAFTPVRRWLEGFVDRRFSVGHHVPTEPRPAPAAEASHRLRPTVLHGPAVARSVAGASGHRVPAHAQLRAVDEAGNVDCPLRDECTLRDCLRCPRLLAFVDEPALSVVCDLPSSS